MHSMATCLNSCVTESLTLEMHLQRNATRSNVTSSVEQSADRSKKKNFFSSAAIRGRRYGRTPLTILHSYRRQRSSPAIGLLLLHPHVTWAGKSRYGLRSSTIV